MQLSSKYSQFSYLEFMNKLLISMNIFDDEEACKFLKLEYNSYEAQLLRKWYEKPIHDLDVSRESIGSTSPLATRKTQPFSNLGGA